LPGPAAKDLEYWKLMAETHLSKAKADIARYEHEMDLYTLDHEAGWVVYYRNKLDALEAGPAKALAELAVLRREGFAAGGLVGSYDSGGYLPVGLSMAFNGTGRPEPVGGAPVQSTRPLVNRIEFDVKVLAEQLTEHMRPR